MKYKKFLQTSINKYLYLAFFVECNLPCIIQKALSSYVLVLIQKQNIFPDYPGLENPSKVNDLRQNILIPFRAYTTGTFWLEATIKSRKHCFYFKYLYSKLIN